MMEYHIEYLLKQMLQYDGNERSIKVIILKEKLKTH